MKAIIPTVAAKGKANEVYNSKYVSILDPSFLYSQNQKRFYKFYALLKKSDLHDKISFACQVRADEINEDIAKKMRELNFERVFIGVESFNQRVLNRMNKKISVNQIEKAIKICIEQKLNIYCNLIIGHPGEDEKSLNETLSKIKSLSKLREDAGLEWGFTVLAIYPRTKLWDMVDKGEGIYWIDGYRLNWNKFHCSVYGKQKPSFYLDTLSAEKIEEWYNKFNEEISNLYKAVR